MINKKLGKTLALLACVSISLYPANQGRAYSGNDAMKYAEKWYNGYNTKQYYKAGKDCTNFVSQCMVAGGKKKSSSLPKYYSEKHWRPHSATWENATYFRKYWKDRAESNFSVKLDASKYSHDVLIQEKKKISSRIMRNLKVGDVIQYGSSSSDVRHSQIIVGLIYDPVTDSYTYRLAQHSSPSNKCVLTDYLSTLGGTTYCYKFSTK